MNLRSVLYEKLVPTLGRRALPALFGRLRKVCEGDDFYLLDLVAGAIAAAEGDDVGCRAAQLLVDSSTRAQRAGLKILARRPTAGFLDRLWDIHCDMTAAPGRFLRVREHAATLHEESFGALLACIRLEPSWLAGAIGRAIIEQPVHDLAYLLGNLDGHEALWRQCKAALFAKISPTRERCLAVNIFRHRDTTEVQWLIERIAREDDLLGPWALRALCRLDPDLAVRELPRLPIQYWSTTRHWCFAEIQRQRPQEARACVQRLLANPAATHAALVYDGDSAAVDAPTLEILLDRLQDVLAEELAVEGAGASAQFNVLCQLLRQMNRLEQLMQFQRRQGTLLEERLTSWLMRRGPVPDDFARKDQEDALSVLEKVGGSGFTRVNNRYLKSTNFSARLAALKDAARRPDWETLAHLAYLSTKREVHSEAGPVEQGYAALALLAAGEHRRAVESVVRWGLRTLVQVVERMAETSLADEALAPAWTALDEGGSGLPGAVLVLGAGAGPERRVATAERVRGLLRTAEQGSDLAQACIIALRFLNDRSSEVLPLVIPYLAEPTHRAVAINTLAGVESDAGNDALLAHLQQYPNDNLAIHLLNQPRTAQAVAPIIRQQLETATFRRSELIGRLLLRVEDAQVLEKVIDDPSARNALHEAAFAEEEMVWVSGARAAAIRALTRFDAGNAWEATRLALENPASRERERYPDLLVELDPIEATPVLMNLLLGEKDKKVRWAVGRALGTSASVPDGNVARRLSDWLTSSDPARRRSACEVLGWATTLSVPQLDALRACLLDVDESVSAAADQALGRLRDAEDVCAIARAIATETDASRRWRLLDALLSVADPGEGHQNAPEWCRQVWQILPPALRDHLNTGLKRRREELAWHARRE